MSEGAQHAPQEFWKRPKRYQYITLTNGNLLVSLDQIDFAENRRSYEVLTKISNVADRIAVLMHDNRHKVATRPALFAPCEVVTPRGCLKVKLYHRIPFP
ncbi:unnamed protein product [Pieris macdunnoughi]|uniref:Uncharacterized protein n=1 Tax=Pieris macdunnoughi TaxID=345717 RepID=A0A821LDY3_9NEOP|nr:unnamed protein product [Pieris macdunnoughi]